MRHVGYGHRLVEAWVHLYTLGVGHEVASARRNELRSDAWEQTTTGHSDWQIVRRVIRGAGADIAWRWTKGLAPSWLRVPVRLAATAFLLFSLASIQHATGTHTFVGNMMYVGWFFFAFVAALSAVIGAWRRFRS